MDSTKKTEVRALDSSGFNQKKGSAGPGQSTEEKNKKAYLKRNTEGGIYRRGISAGLGAYRKSEKRKCGHWTPVRALHSNEFNQKNRNCGPWTPLDSTKKPEQRALDSTGFNKKKTELRALDSSGFNQKKQEVRGLDNSGFNQKKRKCGP